MCSCIDIVIIMWRVKYVKGYLFVLVILLCSGVVKESNYINIRFIVVIIRVVGSLLEFCIVWVYFVGYS